MAIKEIGILFYGQTHLIVQPQDTRLMLAGNEQ